ncbi:MAG: ferredoxin family protein [Clostridia bacterium]|uniref:4Fe-4S binding protein n=1 Tax=Desulfitibacter alkalitolerans TaxID=264641 RepID=UPI00047F1D6E|nr:ferredoxin family protein [Desulfitibacter alkalitolerans]MBS3968981.1 ferredoxin family protein [Clostridia bacterium]
MTKIMFHEDACKGCELCIEFCPKNLITLASRFNDKGFHPATVENTDKCVGCAICARMCPDVAIEIEEIPFERGAAVNA